MRARLPLLALALLALPARAEDAAEEALDARTKTAIERGVAQLLSEQKRDGSWSGEPGNTALVLLALHRSGLREGHRGFDRGLRWLRHCREALDRTYETSLRLMLLAEISPTEHAEAIRKLALRLVMSQCENGQWTYKAVPGRVKDQGDNSNTQFALLALWAARLADVAVPQHVWSRAGKHFRATQNEDGGWGYSHNQRRNSYGSMTAGGLMAMTIVTAAPTIGHVDVEAVRGDASVARAVAWLGRELAVDTNPGVTQAFGGKTRNERGAPTRQDYWPLYWLWSLERAGRILDVERFGEHDWYPEGAKRLLDTQKEDGRWVGSNPEYATSFALLFLTRKTKPITTEPITGTATTPREKADGEKDEAGR